jgi:hypothetical protein
MRIFPIALLTILLLSGCTSLDKKYHEPKPGKLKPAVVSAVSKHSSDDVFNENRILLIDGKPLDPSIEGVNIKVEPGTHLITLGSEFDTGEASGGPFESLTKIHLTANPDMHYRIVTKVDGASLAVWGEDANGQRVTDIALSPYGYASGYANEAEHFLQ